MTAILVYRRGSTLIPADRLAAEDIERLGAAKPILVEARQPRSLPHHRLLFGLLRKVADNCEGVSEHALLSWLKVKMGHVDHMPLGFGRTYAAPASINFASMPQTEFNAFFNAAVELICTEVIPGLDKPALVREVNEMLGINDSQGPSGSQEPRSAAAA